MKPLRLPASRGAAAPATQMRLLQGPSLRAPRCLPLDDGAGRSRTAVHSQPDAGCSEGGIGSSVWGWGRQWWVGAITV